MLTLPRGHHESISRAAREGEGVKDEVVEMRSAAVTSGENCVTLIAERIQIGAYRA